MSVNRSRKVTFDIASHSLIDAVGQAARSYRHARPLTGGGGWEMSVRPHWYLLPTRLRAEVSGSGQRSELCVSTSSQWFIVGDVFNFYGRYVDAFIADVGRRFAQTG